MRPPSVEAGVEAGAGAGGVAARCTAAGGAVAGVASALRAGTEPEVRAADDPVWVSAGAGRLLMGCGVAAAGVGGGLLGGDDAVRPVTARCTLGAVLAAGDPAEATGGVGAVLDVPGDGELPGAGGEAAVVAVVVGKGWAGPVGTAGAVGVAPAIGEGPASPATGTGTARCTRTGSGPGVVGREPSGTARSWRGTAR
ncbi:hypothetical protein ACWCQQ_09760 [Streptomyces sp. NPDC002143]